MSTFYAEPELDFNYATWTPNTVVTMANVPWNSDYRDIVPFAKQSDLDAYIETGSAATIRMEQMTYHRPNKPIRIEVPLGRAMRYNYLRAHNPAQPVDGGLDMPMSYYYFITEVEHVSPNTTAVYLQLDVVQTFLYRTKFGNCYVESGHLGIANWKQMESYGRNYLTTPEGLDVGGEYQIVDWYTHEIATARAKEAIAADYAVIVTTTVSLIDDPGTVDDPQLNSSKGSMFGNLPNGHEAYLFSTNAALRVFLEKWSDKPWITQGITSITAVPASFVEEYGAKVETVLVDGFTINRLLDGSLRTKLTTIAPDWREVQRNKIPERYRQLRKFQTYPYTVLELTSNAGAPIMIKPESWNNKDGMIVESAHFAQPGPRLAFYPYRYNAGNDSPTEIDDLGIVNDGGEFLDMATGIFNFPTFSTTNNSYISFMASQNNSIAFQHQSADWSQQRAQTGNQLAFDQSSAGMGLSNDLSQQGIRAQQDQSNLANSTAALSGMSQAISGGVGAAARANPAGVAGAAASAAISTAIGIHQNHQSMKISTGLAAGTNESSVANQGYMRDSNKAYADFATKGDYQNTIASINAKIQDAKLIQPTTSGQVGGDAFLLATYRWGYDLKIKTLDPAAMARVGEFWLRYGYQVNRFLNMSKLPQGFHLMSRFTYWKLKETYIIEGNFPESFKVALRGIFEKGVTVWRDPNDIGKIDIADNYAIAGIEY